MRAFHQEAECGADGNARLPLALFSARVIFSFQARGMVKISNTGEPCPDRNGLENR